jgi:hypothetical protein
MLQAEHEKAQKKIHETTEKADQLEKLKRDNDRAYLTSIVEEERKRKGVQTGNKNFHQ